MCVGKASRMRIRRALGALRSAILPWCRLFSGQNARRCVGQVSRFGRPTTVVSINPHRHGKISIGFSLAVLTAGSCEDGSGQALFHRGPHTRDGGGRMLARAEDAPRARSLAFLTSRVPCSSSWPRCSRSSERISPRPEPRSPIPARANSSSTTGRCRSTSRIVATPARSRRRRSPTCAGARRSNRSGVVRAVARTQAVSGQYEALNAAFAAWCSLHAEA